MRPCFVRMRGLRPPSCAEAASPPVTINHSQLPIIQCSRPLPIDRSCHSTPSPHDRCLRLQTPVDRLLVLTNVVRHVIVLVHSRVRMLEDLVALGIADETWSIGQ